MCSTTIPLIHLFGSRSPLSVRTLWCYELVYVYSHTKNTMQYFCMDFHTKFFQTNIRSNKSNLQQCPLICSISAIFRSTSELVHPPIHMKSIVIFFVGETHVLTHVLRLFFFHSVFIDLEWIILEKQSNEFQPIFLKYKAHFFSNLFTQTLTPQIKHIVEHEDYLR